LRLKTFGECPRVPLRGIISPFTQSRYALSPSYPLVPPGGVVLDPMVGSGTTSLVALKLDRRFMGIEIDPAYVEIARGWLQPYMDQKPYPEYQSPHAKSSGLTS